MVERFSDSLEALRRAPEGRNLVEQALEQNSSESLEEGFAEDRFDLPDMDVCALCEIDKLPHVAGEDIYWRDGGGNYVVKAAEDKGHPVRNMMVYEDHGYLPAETDIEMQDEDPFRKLFEISASHIYNSEEVEDDQVIQTVGMNSVPGHLHVMASNLDIRDNETTDHALTGSYIRWDVSDGEYAFEEPEEVVIRDSIGSEVLKPLYRNSLGISSSDEYEISPSPSRDAAYGMD